MTHCETTTMTIGPLQVIVEAAPPELHRLLRSAYHAFTRVSSPSPYRLTAFIEYTPGPAFVDFPYPSDYQARVLQFTDPRYSGYIDAAARRAYLKFSALQPFDGLSYFVCALVSLLAFEAGGLLLHGAGLIRRERCYVFCAPSGTGKTTVARVSADATVLNDDLIVLLPQADRWVVQATPFTNASQVPPGGNGHAPLTALYRLTQDRQVFVEPLSLSQAVLEVLSSVRFVTVDPERVGTVLGWIDQLARSVPVQRLHFLPDASFWTVVQPCFTVPP